MSIRTLLSAIWLDRLTAAEAALAHAERAPALHNVAYVETLRDDAAKARKQYLFWLRYGAPR